MDRVPTVRTFYRSVYNFRVRTVNGSSYDHISLQFITKRRQASLNCRPGVIVSQFNFGIFLNQFMLLLEEGMVSCKLLVMYSGHIKINLFTTGYFLELLKVSIVFIKRTI